MELLVLIMFIFSGLSLLVTVYLWYEVDDLKAQLHRPAKPRARLPSKPVIKVARKPGYWD